MTLSCSMLIAAAIATGAPDARIAQTTNTAPQVPVAISLMAATADTPALEPQLDLRATIRKPERWTVDQAERRPAILPAMYTTLGALNVLDVYSTRRAIGAGANEANPLMRPSSGNSGAMLAIKALSTAGTIYFAERAWKKNRKGAIVLMAVINGVTAAIAANNFRNASR